MSLIENTLFGIIDKIKIATIRLKEYEPEEGYYLAFSGGKDSIVLEHLTKGAGVKYDAHYNVTGIDHPSLFRFIRRNYPDVALNMPETNIFALALSRRSPPMRKMRFCCNVLKERGGEGRLVLTGIRWAESTRRLKTRKMYEVCYRSESRRFLHPIIDWTSNDIWSYIEMKHLPYPELYDKGYTRLGCIMCPEGGAKQMTRHAHDYPKMAQRWIRCLDDILKLKKAPTFKNGKEYFDWWISGKHNSSNDNQGCFFFDNEAPLDLPGGLIQEIP